MSFILCISIFFSQGLTNENDPEPIMFGDYEFTYSDNNLQYFPVQVNFLYSNKFLNFYFYYNMLYFFYLSILTYAEHSNQSTIRICRIKDTQQSWAAGLHMFIQIPRSRKTSLRINRITQRFLFTKRS